MNSRATGLTHFGRLLVFVGTFAATVSVLYPPWVYTFQTVGTSQVRRPATYNWIFLPPAPLAQSVAYGVAIDYGRLGLQAAGLGFVVGMGLLLTAGISRPAWRRQRDSTRHPKRVALGSLGLRIK